MNKPDLEPALAHLRATPGLTTQLYIELGGEFEASCAWDMDLEEANDDLGTTTAGPSGRPSPAAAPAQQAEPEIIELLDISSDDEDASNALQALDLAPAEELPVPVNAESVAPDNPPAAQAPRAGLAALNATGTTRTPEKSMFRTMYYAAWRECLHNAMQQYPEEARTVTQLHMKAKDLALKLPITREGVQKFVQYIQGWLKQGLGEARAQQVYACFKERYSMKARTLRGAQVPNLPPSTSKQHVEETATQKRVLEDNRKIYAAQQQLAEQQAAGLRPQTELVQVPLAQRNQKEAWHFFYAARPDLKSLAHTENPESQAMLQQEFDKWLKSRPVSGSQPTIRRTQQPGAQPQLLQRTQAQQAQQQTLLEENRAAFAHLQQQHQVAQHAAGQQPQAPPTQQRQPQYQPKESQEEIKLWAEFFAARPDLKVLAHTHNWSNHSMLQQEFDKWLKSRPVSGSQAPQVPNDQFKLWDEFFKIRPELKHFANTQAHTQAPRNHPVLQREFDGWRITMQRLEALERANLKLYGAVRSSFKRLGASEDHMRALEVVAELSQKMEDAAGAMALQVASPAPIQQEPVARPAGAGTSGAGPSSTPPALGVVSAPNAGIAQLDGGNHDLRGPVPASTNTIPPSPNPNKRGRPTD